ncbi:MAG: GAF domain-containing protein, partial [Deltaproteobacteria bacterium]
MTTDTVQQDSPSVQSLRSEVEFQVKSQDLNKKIFAAANLDEILIDLKDDIIGLFEAERLTIYYVDGIKRELVSRFKSGNEIEEIRVPLSPKSIAGYSAYKQKLVNIRDVYDSSELKVIDPILNFDRSWDEKTGLRTTQVLVAPIIFKKLLLGAIQLINRKKGSGFTATDEKNILELAETLGIGLYNQKRMATGKTGRKTKYDYLLENHILTQKELKNVVLESRE